MSTSELFVLDPDDFDSRVLVLLGGLKKLFSLDQAGNWRTGFPPATASNENRLCLIYAGTQGQSRRALGVAALQSETVGMGPFFYSIAVAPSIHHMRIEGGALDWVMTVPDTGPPQDLLSPENVLARLRTVQFNQVVSEAFASRLQDHAAAYSHPPAWLNDIWRSK